jgi:hypothetical protein
MSLPKEKEPPQGGSVWEEPPRVDRVILSACK